MAFLKKIIYLFIFSERGREGELHQSDRETSCASPDQGPRKQPGLVPWLGIELVTLCFAGWCPAEPHWSGLDICFYVLWWYLGIQFLGHIVGVQFIRNCWWDSTDIYSHKEGMRFFIAPCYKLNHTPSKLIC